MRKRNIIPPPAAQRLLLRFLRHDLAEEVLGDLDEKFHATVKNKSLFRAKLNYWYQVANYMRPFALKRSGSLYVNHYAMYRSYFKLGWRNLVKQKMYSAIKIGGFALGIAACILIAFFIRHELSYDKHYVNGHRIYRIYNDVKGENGGKWTAFPAPIAQVLENDFPEIEKAGRLIPYNWYNAGSNLFRREDQRENTYEEGFAYADQEFLDILEVPMVYGSRRHALAQPNTLVISRHIADKYYPGKDPTGRTIILNEDKSRPWTIGGVMENFPATSHLRFDFLITLTDEEFWPGEQTNWCCWNYNPYVLLRPEADPAELEKKLLSVRDNYYVKYLEETGNKSLEDVKKNYYLRLQPVGDIHLGSAGTDDSFHRGDIRYVWLFGGVACFILLLACINFINLSTARSANRAREVGLRKVVGSLRRYIVRQFLVESLLFSGVSFALAILIVSVALPYFNLLAGQSIVIPWTAWWFLPLLLAACFVVGILAGAYPAFYLSAFRPANVLKGSVSRGSRSSKMRSVMVVFQFTTSIVLIIGTFIIYRQMNYILTTNVGFDKEQVIMIQGANTLDKQAAFKNELLRLPGVQGVTISQYLPVEGTKRDMNQFWRDGKSTEEMSVGAQKWYVDEDYISTMGMKLLDGRTFNPEIASDSQAIIINRAMAKEFGFKNPVGERIMTWETYEVIGVVEDFHFESMKGAITPLCFVLGRWGSIVSIKAKTGDMSDLIRKVSDTWNEFMPHQPIRYTFLDESYARMYEDVQRMGRLFSTFAVLAIVIACLGLFALSAFMVEQRGKEISIRVVLGASVNNIFRLLTQNFVTLVLISFVIAVPIAWYMMQTWLEDYAYRIDITWDVFVLGGIISVFIALLTVSYQSVRAALTNPVNNLRSE